MGKEKRRYIRWRGKIRVAYSLAESPESYQEVFTEDLSELGLQVLISDKLELEQIVRLKLEFVYDSVPIMALGKVVHLLAYRNQYKVGLEFVDMSDFERQRLKRCLDKVNQGLKEQTQGGYAQE